MNNKIYVLIGAGLIIPAVLSNIPKNVTDNVSIINSSDLEYFSNDFDSNFYLPELIAKQPDKLISIPALSYTSKLNCDPHCANLSNYSSPVNSKQYFQRKSFQKNNNLGSSARKQFNSFNKQHSSVLENKLKYNKLSSRINV